jgi:hypothetical protein
MKNAFLVSDEDLRSLRTEPWFIELNGPAVFMHESVLRLLQRQQLEHTNTPTNGHGDGPHFCKIPTCDKSKPNAHLRFFGFKKYMNLRSHEYSAHGIAGNYKKPGPNARAKELAPPYTALPPPNGTEKLAGYLGAESYNYKEFDAKGICGIGDCNYKDKRIKSLHFHRSVKHQVRGVNWRRNYHQAKRKGKRNVGRPRKVA